MRYLICAVNFKRVHYITVIFSLSRDYPMQDKSKASLTWFDLASDSATLSGYSHTRNVMHQRQERRDYCNHEEWCRILASRLHISLMTFQQTSSLCDPIYLEHRFHIFCWFSYIANAYPLKSHNLQFCCRYKENEFALKVFIFFPSLSSF